MIVQSGVLKERPSCINLLMYKQTHTQTHYYSQAATTSDTTGNRHTHTHKHNTTVRQLQHQILQVTDTQM